MIRHNWVTLVCAVAVPLGALALAEGCSSSSNGAAPQVDGGSPDATQSFTDGAAPDSASSNANADAGAISLTWGTVLIPSGTPQQGDGGTDAATGSDAATDAGASDAASVINVGTDASVTYTGNYNGTDGGPPAIPGVQICAYLYSDVKAMAGALPPQSTALSCVSSAADGTFVIPSVPARTSMVLTLTKAGFVPIALSIQTASSPMDVRQYPVFMYETSVESIPSSLVTVDWQNKGQIFLFAAGAGGDAGAAASVSMNTMGGGAAPSGTGPFYDDPNGGVSSSATGFFPSSGALGVSTARYFNVSAGTYTLTMNDPGNDCEPDLMPLAAWGFPVVSPAHSIQVAVFNGYISGFVGFICLPQSVLVSVDGG